MHHNTEDLRVPRAFLSLDLETNISDKGYFINEIDYSTVKFAIRSWSSPLKRPYFKWDKEVKEFITRCDFTIVLVDEFTFSAKNVIREIHMSNKHKVPVFGVYIPGIKKSCKLPMGLLKERTIKWDWNLIGGAVNLIMNHEMDKWALLR